MSSMKVLTWTLICINRHHFVTVCRPGHGASGLLPLVVQEGLEGGSLPTQEATRGRAGVQQARKKTASISEAEDEFLCTTSPVPTGYAQICVTVPTGASTA